MQKTLLMWRQMNGTAVLDDLSTAVEKMILEEKKTGFRLRICIGTDSQVKGATTEYATVVVLLREGHGGRMLVHKSREKQQISIKERLLKEVAMSIETAYSLLPVLNSYNIALEVHADINSDPQFKSQPSFAEAKGYILGMGFEFKAKPYAFASSSCANKMVN